MAAANTWDGQVLTDADLSFTLYTNVVEAPRAIQVPLIAAASAGQVACVIPPHRLGPFLLTHRSCNLICHDVGILHWVLHEHFRVAGNTAASEALWGFSRNCRD